MMTMTERKRSAERSSGESLDARLGTAQYQRVNIVRALVGVHCFEIHHMADDMVFVRDTIAAVDVACGPGDVQRLSTIVALEQ